MILKSLIDAIPSKPTFCLLLVERLPEDKYHTAEGMNAKKYRTKLRRSRWRWWRGQCSLKRHLKIMISNCLHFECCVVVSGHFVVGAMTASVWRPHDNHLSWPRLYNCHRPSQWYWIIGVATTTKPWGQSIDAGDNAADAEICGRISWW